MRCRFPRNYCRIFSVLVGLLSCVSVFVEALSMSRVKRRIEGAVEGLAMIYVFYVSEVLVFVVRVIVMCGQQSANKFHPGFF